MIPALLDPWLVSPPLDATERFAKFSSLSDFFRDVLRAHPLLEVAGFMDGPQSASLKAWLYTPPLPRAVAGWFFPLLGKLIRSSSGTQAANIVGAPAGLATGWLEVLWEVTDPSDLASWREPILFVPSARSADWPNGTLVIVMARGCETERLLVCIEAVEDHPEFKRCLDPWLHREPVAPKDATDAQRRRLMRLPRPPQAAASVAIDSLGRALAATAHPYPVRAGDHYYYVPQGLADWEPHTMPRDDWMRRCFPIGSKQTRKGEKKGPIDCNGAVWAWDIEEEHWDVQHPDRTRPAAYSTVSNDGRVLKVVE